MAKTAVRTISIKVDDIEPGKAIKKIKAEFKAVKKAVDEADETSEAYYKNVARLGQLKGAINKHNSDIRKISRGWKDTKEGVSGYSGKQEGLLGQFGNILSKGKTAYLAVAAGVAVAAKAVGDYVIKNKELKRDLSRTEKVGTASLNRIAATVTALEVGFETSSNNIQDATKAIKTNLGDEATESLEFIEKAFIAGGNASGDLTEQLQEYAPVFAEMGKGTEDFTAQIVKAQQMGVKGDYGLAAIEEAQLRLRQMPKSTQEALDAIGLSSNQIRKQIEEEGIGAAIETVAAQLDTLEDDSPEVGQALADIFGASGEKAGLEYVKSLSTIGGSLDDLIDTTNEYTTAQIRQHEFTKNLETIKGRLADSISGVLFPAFSSLVGVANDYLSIPLSQQLAEEQNELNVLVGTLSSNIENQEIRNSLIKELNQKYPDFLKNMDTENLTTAQLAGRLEEVNNQYLAKIILQKQDEKIQSELQKQADTFQKKRNRAKDVEAEFLKIGKEHNIVYKEGATAAEKYDAVWAKIGAKAKKGGIFNQAFRDVKSLNKLIGNGSSVQTGLKALNNQYEKQTGILKDLNAERAELEADLKAEGILPTLETPDKPDEPDNNSGGSGKNQSSFVPAANQKVIDENAKGLETLRQQLAQHQQDVYLQSLSANEKEIEQIKQKYQQQIEAAKGLGANAEEVALKELMFQEIEKKSMEHGHKLVKQAEEQLLKQFELEEEAINKAEELENQQYEDKLLKEAEYEEQRAAFKNELKLQLSTDYESELLQLDAHYEALLQKAAEFNIAQSEIEALEKQRKEKEEAIKAKFEKKQQDKATNEFKERIQARADSYNALGNIFSSVGQLMVNSEGKALAAQRVFTLASIAMNAAAGIAAAIKAGAGVPFPGNLGAIASGVGAVVTGISQARKALVVQKKDGRYLTVTGKDDNKEYNAKKIGTQATGMLPNYPVLLNSEVLASEEGREYFVSNKSLSNPLIMQHVQAIENIESGSAVQQFKGGGAIGSIPTSDNTLLINLLTELNDKLSTGLQVNIGFKEIEKMQSLSNQLNQMN